ncbi:MAG TPA: hypothetical protein VGM43_22680 [Bryobacteraceae bacterium]
MACLGNSEDPDEEWIAQAGDPCGGPLFEELMRISALDRRLLMVARMEVHPRLREIEAARRLSGKQGLRAVFDSAFYLQHNADVRAAGRESAGAFSRCGGSGGESASFIQLRCVSQGASGGCGAEL